MTAKQVLRNRRSCGSIRSRTSATSKRPRRVPQLDTELQAKQSWRSTKLWLFRLQTLWSCGVLATEHWTVPHLVDDSSQDLLHFCKFSAVRARFFLGWPHCYGDALAAFVEENRGDGARAFGHALKCTVMGTVGVMTQKQYEYDVTEICQISFFWCFSVLLCLLLVQLNSTSWQLPLIMPTDYVVSSER